MPIFIILCVSHSDVNDDACHTDIVSDLDDVADVALFYQLLFWTCVLDWKMIFLFLSMFIYYLILHTSHCNMS